VNEEWWESPVCFVCDRWWILLIGLIAALAAYFTRDYWLPLAPDEAALAQSIIEQAKAAGAQELPAPESRGKTGGELTEVIIQNDSPNRIRIVFSGPETHVEVLEACSSCITYYLYEPTTSCPEQAPIGRYTLEPGQYDVVVEDLSDTTITPWFGNWQLVSGDEYYSCFFIVTTFEP